MADIQDLPEWPVFGWANDIRPPLAEALAAGRSVALATLFRVEGSAPREAGTQMLFDGPDASGYFSGDCIEGDVARHAVIIFAPKTFHHTHARLPCLGVKVANNTKINKTNATIMQ